LISGIKEDMAKKLNSGFLRDDVANYQAVIKLGPHAKHTDLDIRIEGEVSWKGKGLFI
jgi:hypothetical protein